MPKAPLSTGREESAVLGKAVGDSKGVGKGKKAQENKKVLFWFHAPSCL